MVNEVVNEIETASKVVKSSRRTSESSGSTEREKISRKVLRVTTSNDKIGAMLANERVKKGLNLDEIARTLCIRKFYLEAIEKGNYGDLPPIPYSVGFVGSYAKYLGMNHTRIAQLFREEISEKKDKTPIIINDDTPAEAAVPNKIYIVIGVVVVLLIALIWGFLTPSSGDEEPVKEDVVETEVKEDDSDKTGKVEYFEAELPTKTEEVPAEVVAVEKNVVPQQIVISEDSYEENTGDKPRTVEIKITKDDTWVSVRDSKKVYISKVLKVGESYRLPNVKGLLLSSGKYYGVEIYVDGKLTPVIKPNRKTNINLDKVLGENQ